MACVSSVELIFGFCDSRAQRQDKIWKKSRDGENVQLATLTSTAGVHCWVHLSRCPKSNWRCWICTQARFVGRVGCDGYCPTQRVERKSERDGQPFAHTNALRHKVLCRTDAGSSSTMPRLGMLDPCENPGLQPNDWNPFTMVRMARRCPGVSVDLVNDPNVLVWLTSTGPKVLGGLSNDSNVRERQSTNECVRAMLCAKMKLTSPKTLMNALESEKALEVDELDAELILIQHIPSVQTHEAPLKADCRNDLQC